MEVASMEFLTALWVRAECRGRTRAEVRGQINEQLYAEIKEQVHKACEDDDENVSERAFALLALFDALEGADDGSLSAEELVTQIVGLDEPNEEPEMVECVECGAETADPGVGVRCEEEIEGRRCNGR